MDQDACCKEILMYYMDLLSLLPRIGLDFVIVFYPEFIVIPHHVNSSAEWRLGHLKWLSN